MNALGAGSLVFCLIGAVVVIGIIFLANAIRIVPEYQRLVVFRLGRVLDKPKGPGIIILIKSNQSSFRSQLLQDCFGMSAATKCAVDINTGFLNIQRRYCFLKQYRYMIVDGLIG